MIRICPEEPMRLLRPLTALVALLGLALWPSPGSAQVGAAFAQLNGTVQDASGRTIVKASITLRDLETNRAYMATSNVAGYYLIPNLPPGRYELTVQYTGFAKYTNPGIVLSVAQTATVDVTMKVASVPESVTVTT